jgi:hypothetical protein
MKIGSGYDEEWIEHQFQTEIVSHCDAHGNSTDQKGAQKAFQNCLNEGLAPRATAKLLKSKCEALLKIRTEASQPTNAILASIDYLKNHIDLIDKVNAPQVPLTFRKCLKVKGDSKDLNVIYNNLNVSNEKIQVVKNCLQVFNMNDKKSQDGLKNMSVNPNNITDLDIYFNSDPEQLKQVILQRFPNVKFG